MRISDWGSDVCSSDLTPGHGAIVVSSEGQEAVITGDLIHHPVQVAIPHVGDNFCWNHDMARSTRRTVLERVADRSALLLGSHFAGPTGVYLTPDGEAWIVEDRKSTRLNCSH